MNKHGVDIELSKAGRDVGISSKEVKVGLSENKLFERWYLRV